MCFLFSSRPVNTQPGLALVSNNETKHSSWSARRRRTKTHVMNIKRARNLNIYISYFSCLVVLAAVDVAWIIDGGIISNRYRQSCLSVDMTWLTGLEFLYLLWGIFKFRLFTQLVDWIVFFFKIKAKASKLFFERALISEIPECLTWKKCNLDGYWKSYFDKCLRQTKSGLRD